MLSGSSGFYVFNEERKRIFRMFIYLKHLFGELPGHISYPDPN